MLSIFRSQESRPADPNFIEKGVKKSVENLYTTERCHA